MESVRARAYLGLRQLDAARASANDVLKLRPDDVPALTVLAMAEEADDRWRHAATYWTRIHRLNGDPAAAERRDALVGVHPTQVTVTSFFEGSAAVDAQYGVRASGAWRPLDGPEWTANAEARQADANAAPSLAGNLRPVDENRQRFDLGVADTLSFGRLSLNVLAAQNGIGARVGYGRAMQWGGVELFASANESYWLYSAGISNGARTDYFGASVNAYFGGIGGRVSVRKSTYGVEDNDNIAESTRITVGVDAPLTKQPNPYRLSYILDAEDFSRIDQRTSIIGGGLFSPVPFADRQVHSLGIFKDFGDVKRSYITLGGGYRTDRYSVDGAFVHVAAETPLAEKVRLGVRVEYSKTSVRGLDEDGYTFGEAYVRKVF